MATTFNDFESFAHAASAHQNANPTWIRLNGKPTTGDQDAWAFFWHIERKWKVDADTSFLPVLLAFEHFASTGEDPFTVQSTDKRDCLEVVDQVRQALIATDEAYLTSKYLYIYSPRPKLA